MANEVSPYTAKPGSSFLSVISAIFYNVVEGKATLDQLIDWVRSVEPAELVEPAVEPVAEYKTVMTMAGVS